MAGFANWGWALGLALGTSFSALAASASSLSERDLAVLLPADDPEMRLGFDDVGFIAAWYRGILESYAGTSVGEGIQRENNAASWRLVAMRVVPCQSLFSRPHSLETSFCWPEVRLVLQPIEKNVEFLGRRVPYFADDRAIHVLYNFESAQGGFPESLTATLLKAFEEVESRSISPEWALFESARDRAVETLLEAVKKLRDPSIASDAYKGFDLRPESQSSNVAVRRAFRSRLKTFLVNLSAPFQNRKNLPKEVTSFSLPEGREPTVIDEWVFVKLKPVGQETILPQNIPLLSVKDGTKLSEVPFAQVTMSRDEPAIYDDFASLQGTPYESELKENLILFIPDIRKNGGRIADVTRVRVPNTTCGSCHKLNDQRFDFHNLSYLQEKPMTVSPRVEMDVSFDLKWLNQAGL